MNTGGGGRRLGRLPALAAGLSVLATAACGAPVVGVPGVGVDPQGQPVGYLAICEEHVDVVTLSLDADGSEASAGSATVTAGRWASGEPVTGGSSWSMAEPASGWEAGAAFLGVMPGNTYHLRGWARDDHWSTDEVSFTAEDLAGGRPGEVLTTEYAPATDSWVVVVQDEAEFFAEQCGGWGAKS